MGFLMDIVYYLKHVCMGKKKREVCPRCGKSPFVHGFFPNERFFCNHCELWSPLPPDICPRCGSKLVQVKYDMWLPSSFDDSDTIPFEGMIYHDEKGMACKKCDVIW